MAGTHPEHQDFPWTIAVVDHPPRKETAAFARSRRLMIKLVGTIPDWVLAGDAYEDHHGGAIWVKDATGWLCVQLPLGIEWSAQFCADPAKVDRLRQYAERVVAAFPDTLPGYSALGYKDAAELLATPVASAVQVAAWTDSIFNASLPLPRAAHTGVLPAGAGYHHYPKPIVDIDHFRFDDFQLFVTDPEGLPAVVVPVARRGSGDGRVRLIAAHPDSRYVRKLIDVDAVRHADDVEEMVASAGTRRSHTAVLTDDDPDVLADTDPLAQEAFARQPVMHRRSRAARPKNLAIGPKRSSR
ncbi:MAG: hypothetical protein QOJ68_3231 [Blastococcus sp.]|jgi:hypothetical protein|nr:hypothetical protein [Blastococcus sp.]